MQNFICKYVPIFQSPTVYWYFTLPQSATSLVDYSLLLANMQSQEEEEEKNRHKTPAIYSQSFVYRKYEICSAPIYSHIHWILWTLGCFSIFIFGFKLLVNVNYNFFLFRHHTRVWSNEVRILCFKKISACRCII